MDVHSLSVEGIHQQQDILMEESSKLPNNHSVIPVTTAQSEVIKAEDLQGSMVASELATTLHEPASHASDSNIADEHLESDEDDVHLSVQSPQDCIHSESVYTNGRVVHPETVATTATTGRPNPHDFGAENIPIHNGLRIVAPPVPGIRRVLVKSSIPPIEGAKYVRECEAAAIASRLPPHHMSPLEASLMRQHLSHLQVTTYVTTRNAILRLWVKNPMLWVSMEEAQGVAREERHFYLCKQIWEFLIRHGYINHGCLDVPSLEPLGEYENREIVVVGAGISGLAVARHLQTLLAVFQERIKYNYRVTVLEARSRIGGRVYSHRLKHDKESSSAMCHVDLGAQIVTGFSGGNPLTTLLQRQLYIPYHSLVHARKNKIHGADGQILDSVQDLKVEGLFNLLLDAAARFRYASNKDTIVDPDTDTKSQNGTVTRDGLDVRPENAVVAVADKVLGGGKTTGVEAAKAIVTVPLEELQRLGFTIRADAQIPPIREAESLGQTMTNVLEAYSEVAEITTSERTILKWHWANMEYACGTNLDNLSLRHWDQDDGNEFRGHHAMVIGGYAQLARGLALAPIKLNIRTNAVVHRIAESGLVLRTGEPIAADKIVVTLPLGVLKSDAIEFSPQLPDWKLDAISKLGFGLLNKVVLVYDDQFWENDIDLLGRVPTSDTLETENTIDTKGRFYMFWNCTTHACGRPVLVALMAGDAAFTCETTENDILIQEATRILRRIYPQKQIPVPSESIVTRWGSDPFARGSYSYIGTNGTGADYEAMARAVDGRLFFAGEATCRTHPSTVHGAYLSGLAAASAVLDSIIGPQEIPGEVPLVPIKTKPGVLDGAEYAKKRKHETDRIDSLDNEKEKDKHLKKLRLSEKDEALTKLIEGTIGPRPEQPKRMNANPFLIFQKEKWQECRVAADDLQKKKQNDPNAKATKNQIRACLGQTWRDTTEEGRKFWTEIVNQRKQDFDTLKTQWDVDHAEWERRRIELTKHFEDRLTATGLPANPVSATGAILAEHTSDTNQAHQAPSIVTTLGRSPQHENGQELGIRSAQTVETGLVNASESSAP